MKKIYYFLCLFIMLFLQGSSSAQTLWTAQTSGTASQLNGVFFTSASNGYIAGNDGIILNTNNGGQSWSRQGQGLTTQAMMSVFFINPNLGWAVGGGGVVLRTQNAGVLWEKKVSGTSNNLNSVFFRNENLGWAVGGFGKIIKTINGGLTWSLQTSGTSTLLSSVYFVSDTEGWAVGQTGLILHSIDGGTTWSQQTSGTSLWLLSVKFTSSSTGYAVGATGTVLKTTDGGLHWITKETNNPNSLISICFPIDSIAWAVGNGGTIIKTTNAGEGWSLESSGTGNHLQSVYFASPTSGWAVGANGTIVKYNCSGPNQPSIVSGPLNQCVSTSQVYSVAQDLNASKYFWTLPAGWEGQSNSNSISIKATANSVAGSLTVVASNGCGNSSASSMILNKPSDVPAQPSSITGAASQCVGTSQVYSVAKDLNANKYSWTLPSGWEGQSDSSGISVKASANSVAGAITVIANNGCGNSSSSTMVLNKPSDVPAQPSVISGSSSQCIGTSQVYSVTKDNNSNKYSWTLPAGWEGQSDSSSISVKATANSVAGSITVTANNVCGNSSSSIMMLNKPSDVPAQPSVISGSSSQCIGTSQVYSVTKDINANKYSWVLPSGWEGQSDSSSISVKASANSVAGAITVIANNGCGNSSSSTMVLNKPSDVPAQPSVISGQVSQCVGASQVYSVAKDINANKYFWTLPAGWEGQSDSSSISVKASANSVAGSIAVTASNGCGNSSASSLMLNKPSDVPAQPSAISGPASQCVGTSQVYSVAKDNNANKYSWTLPAGWEGQSDSSSISVKASANSVAGSIAVTASNGCGNSSASSLMLNKPSDVPAQPSAISGPASQCVGTSQVYSVAKDNNANKYSWTLPAGWEGQSDSSSISVKATANSVAGSITVTANNVCGNSSSSIMMLNKPSDVPAQPSVISGSSSQCIGTLQVYSVTKDINANKYSWTLPAGWEGQSDSSSISVKATVNSVAGAITVTASNGCGNSSSSIMMLNKPSEVPAQPSVISGPSVHCVGTSQMYSVINDAAVQTYNWSLPSGWEGQSNLNSINIKATDNSINGMIQLLAKNGCGQSIIRTLAINKPYNLPTPIISQNGKQLTTQATGVNFQWKLGQILVGINSNSFTPSQSGSYRVVVTDKVNGCKDSSETFNFVMNGKQEVKCYISFYPNPAKDELTIEFEYDNSIDKILNKLEGKGILNSKNSEIISNLLDFTIISITNLQGRTVLNYRSDASKDMIKLSLAGIPKGMYILTIMRGTDLLSKKLVIE